MCRELGEATPRAALSGKTVALVGDLKHGRTVHSLAKALAAFPVSLVFVAPPGLEMPAAIKAVVEAGAGSFAETTDLKSVVAGADALYVTRVQRERFLDPAQRGGRAGILVAGSDVAASCRGTTPNAAKSHRRRASSLRAVPLRYEKTRGSYVVDAKLMMAAKPNCAVLHPLPRVDEISTDFDSDPRAAYFRQMENGLYARMALLDLLLGE